MGYATVYPVVMFLRVLTAQLLMLMAIPAVAAATPAEPVISVEDAAVVVVDSAECEMTECDEEADTITYEELAPATEEAAN
jgi:hypothetical protein